jgi:hypothetical protein
MTVALPDPVPLDMPPEDAAALDELIGMVTVAGSGQEVLADGLSGPAASAPGWLGADAVAAGAQVAVVKELARACQAALLTAATRLRAHAELLGETRAGVARLRDEQQSDFAAGWRRLAREVDYQQAALSTDPAVQAIVDEVGSADLVRRNRHAALLEELARDAAATGRVLTESSAVVGGRARPGDTNDVIATLAARLPGWGDIELAGLGRALAARLFGTSLDGPGLDSSAADMASFAGRPAFAEAFLLALGPARVRVLLRTLGSNLLGPANSLSRVLATAMAAAGPGGRAEEVLHARYLLPSAGDNDAVASGMAVVLLAGGGGSTGVPTATVADWTRQLVTLEHGQDSADGIRTPLWGYPLDDPLGVAVGVLAGRQAVDDCAGLLTDAVVWQTLLEHTWGDGGAALAAVIATAGRAPGLTGDSVVRTGLGVLGDGLPLGDPRRWTVNRVTVGQIRGALGEAVAAHIGVALHAMWTADGGWITDSERAVLRGIGNVSVDCAAMLAIGHALDVRAMAEALAGSRPAPSVALPAVLAPAAWVAVQEYGRRLDYALHGYEQQEDALARQTLFNGSFGLLVWLPGWGGPVASYVVPYLARAMGADGRWDNGSPGWQALGAADALTAVASGSGIMGPATPEAVARARQVYDRTLGVLGAPAPPTSPVIPWWKPAWDAASEPDLEIPDEKAKKKASAVAQLGHLLYK